MSIGPDKLWLIPLFPLLAALVLSLSNSPRLATASALGAMAISLLLSLLAFGTTLQDSGNQAWNFDWLSFGAKSVEIGFLLNPLTAVMLVMVTLVGLLVFIYSTGYMAEDPRYAKFFCFMSLFAGGMLGVVIANSLLLLFMFWEIVGLASYLLIGFWFEKPEAAAAARKAFLTTRVGDIGLFFGMVWLYSETGTLLFYDNGAGCLEAALSSLVTHTGILGIGTATLIALLIFCGAAGKSGQVPLHVWLPDAMEGPTPVSALIHAATMVAAGVFLVARAYPLMDADVSNLPGTSTALTIITWVGAVTAVFAACIAVAQNDIKRILAYSTISQLGYMMLGLGTGGVFAGMFHLLTHAFFKALLFLGAGSVIHGSHGEQDITRMGGLRRSMPVTFATYAIGMMALAGVPIFSGFWSKDEILHSAGHWHNKGPFLLALFGAFLTAFYVTRQVIYVFLGETRAVKPAHESPAVMRVPLIILAVSAVIAGFLGTPAWPWLEAYLSGEEVLNGSLRSLFEHQFLLLAFLSTLIAGSGIATGWHLYQKAPAGDPLFVRMPGVFIPLRNRLWLDEAYEKTIIRFFRWTAQSCSRLEAGFFTALGRLAGTVTVAMGWASRLCDRFLVDSGFDRACTGLSQAAARARAAHGGNIQGYIRVVALAVIVLVLVMAWGCKGQ